MAGSLSTTNKFPIIELENATKNEDPNVPAEMDLPLLQKIRKVVGHEYLANFIENLRFGHIDPKTWKVVAQVRRELSLNEAPSQAYL